MKHYDDEYRRLENLIFDLITSFPVGYDVVMDFDLMTLNRLIERLNEKATGTKKITSYQKEMIERGREEWQKQKLG